MSQIDRAGLYQGVIQDHGMGTTRQKELPQFVCNLLATHKWNDATEAWEEWDFEQTIIGYFVLVHLNAQGEVERCLNYEQIQKALGWDGASFAGLGTGQWKGTEVQFRVETDVYDGKESLKVCWIDAKDAQVGLRKLDAAALSSLDAKYGMTGTKAAPAGAPAVAPKPKPPAAPKPKPKAEAKPKAKPKAKAKPKKKGPPSVAKAPAEAPAPAVAEAPAACTMQEAYDACVAANETLGVSAVPDEVLDDYWTSQAQAIAADTNNVTNEEWAQIRAAVVGDIGLDIPF